jgi:hypothetical protein
VALVRNLMSKDPEQRPESARIVAERLMAWAGDDPSGEDSALGEEVILDSVGSSEFSSVSLPELQTIPEALEAAEVAEFVEDECSTSTSLGWDQGRVAWPIAWLVAVLAFGLTLLGGLLLVAMLIHHLVSR